MFADGRGHRAAVTRSLRLKCSTWRSRSRLRHGCEWRPDNPARRSLMIEARGLSKRFHDKKRGEIRAVDNVSFRCEPGRIYGLLGANGAGKTTALRILATI